MRASTIEIITHSLEETQTLGRKIGVRVGAGTVLALTGELGSGKTAFVQGLARGLDVPDNYYITSPSYTLVNEYPGRFPFFHVDLYRLDRLLDLEDIGLDEMLTTEGVVAIEWAERLHEDHLSDHLSVDFEILTDESRKISITAYGLDGVNLLKRLEK
jgi:tRNA threonylcarbamoyladenosine biosynthesis protein TsaE